MIVPGGYFCLADVYINNTQLLLLLFKVIFLHARLSLGQGGHIYVVILGR